MVVVDEAFKNAGKKCGLEIWRIKEFKVLPLPKNEYGYFYSGDSYIVLSTSSVGNTEAPPFAYALHYWIGNDTTSDEYGTAAIKTVELDDCLGGGPVQYREIQGYESPMFLSYFKSGIKYLQGGYESGFRKTSVSQKWTPRLFHCKGKRVVRCKQVDLKLDSLNMGDVFILDNKTDIYIWCPPESGRMERQKGIEIGNSIRDQDHCGQANIHVLDQDWNNHETFWRLLGGKGPVKSADAGGKDLGHWVQQKGSIGLHKVSDASGKMQITKVAEGDLQLSMLDSKDAFILDAASGGIYVWVGKGCTMDERKKAMQYAAEYLKVKNLPKSTQVIRVLESAEPTVFTQWFAQPKSGQQTVMGSPCAHLYECSDESGRLTVQEIVNFCQGDLDGDDVMMLDTRDCIFVWIGEHANDNEKKSAQEIAKKYLSNQTLPRPLGAKIITMQQGKEAPEFTRYFKNWNANLWKEKKTFEDMKKLAVSSKK